MHISNQIETIYKASQQLHLTINEETHQDEYDESQDFLYSIEHIYQCEEHNQQALEYCMFRLMMITNIVSKIK